jgi:hypothetical protein
VSRSKSSNSNGLNNLDKKPFFFCADPLFQHVARKKAKNPALASQEMRYPAELAAIPSARNVGDGSHQSFMKVPWRRKSGMAGIMTKVTADWFDPPVSVQ